MVAGWPFPFPLHSLQIVRVCVSGGGGSRVGGSEEWPFHLPPSSNPFSLHSPLPLHTSSHPCNLHPPPPLPLPSIFSQWMESVKGLWMWDGEAEEECCVNDHHSPSPPNSGGGGWEERWKVVGCERLWRWTVGVKGHHPPSPIHSIQIGTHVCVSVVGWRVEGLVSEGGKREGDEGSLATFAHLPTLSPSFHPSPLASHTSYTRPTSHMGICHLPLFVMYSYTKIQMSLLFN